MPRVLAALLLLGLALAADGLVVLGAAQYDGRPSPVFAHRLEAAFRLWKAGAAPKILVTGGKRPGDRFSEGGAGCRYLRRLGVPKKALICEEKSTSTWENLLAAKRIFGRKQVILVTDAPHLPRALLLARRLGLVARGYPVRGRFALRYLWRERLLYLAARLGWTH